MQNPIEPSEKYFVKDGVVLPRELYEPHWARNTKRVYEVIRVRNGIPLFQGDHLARLEHSCRVLGLHIDMGEVRRNIRLCITNSVTTERNLQFSILFDPKTNALRSMLSYFIVTSYPEPTRYIDGAPTDLFFAVRQNPNVKLEHQQLKQFTSGAMANKELYEVLLVNNQNQVTEGSRSNLFFITQKEQIVTAPAADVLKGITRGKVMELCYQHGLKCLERAIPIDELGSFVGAFLTGTSPKVLPINRIGRIGYNPLYPTISAIGNLYNNLIETYTENQK